MDVLRDPGFLINLFETYFSDSMEDIYLFQRLLRAWRPNWKPILIAHLRENHFRTPIIEDPWLQRYLEIDFYKLFRMKRNTFFKLLQEILQSDTKSLIMKKYRGGNVPISPEKSLLIFLWYMATQDSLISISETFKVVPSTVMSIVNIFLYFMVRLKSKYIIWPRTDAEINHTLNGFSHYPGTLGAVDGCHVQIKVVPTEQQDSYIDRNMRHSINLMAIANADKIFTYVFIGFPGSVHDSRVFQNSTFYKQIERNGSASYFPNEEYHILGDSAFPIRSWLITPYRQGPHVNRMQRRHNYILSQDRVVIENTFGILKVRWRRIHFINTYSISKAIEITTAACVLHNFCYLQLDEWNDEFLCNRRDDHIEVNDNMVHDNLPEQSRLGKTKRDRISRQLYGNNN